MSPTTLELMAGQSLQGSQRRHARLSSSSDTTTSTLPTEQPASPQATSPAQTPQLTPQASIASPPIFPVPAIPESSPLPPPLQSQASLPRQGSTHSVGSPTGQHPQGSTHSVGSTTQRQRSSLELAGSWVPRALRRSTSNNAASPFETPARQRTSTELPASRQRSSLDTPGSFVHRPGSYRLLADAEIPWLLEPRMSLEEFRSGFSSSNLGPGASLSPGPPPAGLSAFGSSIYPAQSASGPEGLGVPKQLPAVLEAAAGGAGAGAGAGEGGGVQEGGGQQVELGRWRSGGSGGASRGDSMAAVPEEGPGAGAAEAEQPAQAEAAVSAAPAAAAGQHAAEDVWQQEQGLTQQALQQAAPHLQVQHQHQHQQPLPQQVHHHHQQQQAGLARSSFGFPASRHHHSPVTGPSELSSTDTSVPGGLAAAAYRASDLDDTSWHFTPSSRPPGGLLHEADAASSQRSVTPTLLLPQAAPPLLPAGARGSGGFQHGFAGAAAGVVPGGIDDMLYAEGEAEYGSRAASGPYRAERQHPVYTAAGVAASAAVAVPGRPGAAGGSNAGGAALGRSAPIEIPGGRGAHGRQRSRY